MNEYRDIKEKILHAFRDLDYKYTPGTLLVLSDMLNKLEKEIQELLDKYKDEKQVTIFKSREETDDFLKSTT